MYNTKPLTGQGISCRTSGSLPHIPLTSFGQFVVIGENICKLCNHLTFFRYKCTLLYRNETSCFYFVKVGGMTILSNFRHF